MQVDAKGPFDALALAHGRPGAGRGEAPGRVRLRPNRGFPRRTRLRRHPLQSFVRVVHDLRGHWRRLRSSCPSGTKAIRPSKGLVAGNRSSIVIVLELDLVLDFCLLLPASFPDNPFWSSFANFDKHFRDHHISQRSGQFPVAEMPKRLIEYLSKDGFSKT
jgi:hypothetical protein